MYKLKNDKTSNKIKSIGKIKGLKCNTKKGSVTIISAELKSNYAKKQVEKKLKKCYKKIYEFLTSEDDSSDGIKACLGEIEKLKSSIFNKYKEDLKLSDYKEFIAKIAITESEFKNKYYEREYLSNMIKNFYIQEDEMNINRGR